MKEEGFIFEEDESTEDEETEEEKLKRMGKPSYDVEKLLTECGVNDDVKDKLMEHSIDSEIFWDLNEENYEKVL